RALHVDQQETDALLGPLMLARAHQAEHPVRVMCPGRPYLLAIDQVMVATVFGPCLQGCQVRTRHRFRIPLAPPLLGAKNGADEAFLLRGCPEGLDDRPHHSRAEGNDGWAVHLRADGVEQVLAYDAPARTTSFRRPGVGKPALASKNPLPADIVVLQKDLVVLYLMGDIGRKIGGNEFANLFAELFVLG